MCGIWGIIVKNNKLSSDYICDVAKELMFISEIRGKDAAGVSVYTEGRLSVFKRCMTSKEIWKLAEFKDFIHSIDFNGNSILIGHSRLVTNGNRACNNQPVTRNNCSTVHNGIITNIDSLWQQYPEIERSLDVDTEIIPALYASLLCNRNSSGVKSARISMQKVYDEIEGMASTLTIDAEIGVLIAASNNGSLYYWQNGKSDIVIIASEYLFVKRVINKFFRSMYLEEKRGIRQLNYNKIKCWNVEKCCNTDNTVKIELNDDSEYNNSKDSVQIKQTDYLKWDIDFEKIKKIKRCSKCLLPETFPFIIFNKKGICNYCQTYEKQVLISQEKFISEKNRLRKNDAQYGTMVSFSGGRDSSYGLHYFVKEMGLRPIAYCYDWGMVTDLARRNQSRLCSKLGIELIVVAANIRQKRENIKKNVLAWMRNPDLGMVPIFMAGDKQYFYYANKVCREYKIQDILMATNPFEITHFKSGFAGVRPKALDGKLNKSSFEKLPFASVINMIKYYSNQYIKNTDYINHSLVDTASAAISYYFIPHNYFRLFDYIKWDETIINKTLYEEYGWELAPDTETTWRIGDGTAPFYNYIYCRVAGFTENDTLRSNQIREGVITREEGLELIYRDNKPRFDSMKWYFNAIGVDMKQALETVCSMKTLY